MLPGKSRRSTINISKNTTVFSNDIVFLSCWDTCRTERASNWSKINLLGPMFQWCCVQRMLCRHKLCGEIRQRRRGSIPFPAQSRSALARAVAMVAGKLQMLLLFIHTLETKHHVPYWSPHNSALLDSYKPNWGYEKKPQ